MLTMRVQYYQQFDADYSLKRPAEAYGGWKNGEAEVNPAKTALVVMHAWDLGSVEEHPERFLAVDEVPRTYEVCTEVFPSLLSAVRSSPMTVLHVVAGRGYYEKYPGHMRAVKLAGPEPAAPVGAEQDETTQAIRQFISDNSFPGKHNSEMQKSHPREMKFPTEAEPQGDEGIAANAHQLTALCRDAGINHLVYIGFNINWCLLMSAGGMVDMSRRGFICSAIREAVTGVENKESIREEMGKEMGLWRTSLQYGLVFGLEPFIESLKDCDE